MTEDRRGREPFSAVSGEDVEALVERLEDAIENMIPDGRGVRLNSTLAKRIALALRSRASKGERKCNRCGKTLVHVGPDYWQCPDGTCYEPPKAARLAGEDDHER